MSALDVYNGLAKSHSEAKKFVDNLVNDISLLSTIEMRMRRKKHHSNDNNRCEEETAPTFLMNSVREVVKEDILNILKKACEKMNEEDRVAKEKVEQEYSQFLKEFKK
jgi:hypothetical protein